MSLDKAIELRHKLHRIPETAGEEMKTTKMLANYLNKLDFYEVIMLDKSGLIARKSSSEDQPSFLIRCDIDALNIEDEIEEDYRSLHPKKGHKCGHDGHSASIYRLAELIAEKPLSCNIDLLFQPAEEVGRGAQMVLNSGKLRTDGYDYVYAFHNIPSYQTGAIILREGNFNMSVISCAISFQGTSSHASEPEKTISPLPLISSIMALVDSWNKSENDRTGTIVSLSTGGQDSSEVDYGISPGNGNIHLTIRAIENESIDQMKKEILSLIDFHEANKESKISLKWLEEFRSCQNDSQAISIVRSVAESENRNIIEKTNPFPWGEDFGLYTEHYKGAMIGIGNGIDSSPLHSEAYDFNDEVIEVASSLFYNIIRKVCSQ